VIIKAAKEIAVEDDQVSFVEQTITEEIIVDSEEFD
jgi:hypothetical protein